MNFNRTPQAVVATHQDGTPPVTYPDAKYAQVAADSGTYAQFMRPKFARAPIKEAGRVAYLGSFPFSDSTESRLTTTRRVVESELVGAG